MPETPKMPKFANSSIIKEALMEALGTPKPPEPLDPSLPLFANPAVARCYEAYTQAMKEAIERQKGRIGVDKAACKAYCNAMPTLSGLDNIRDFIACVAHGMAMDIIVSAQGTKLLYAAQVAHSTRETRSHRAKSNRP